MKTNKQLQPGHRETLLDYIADVDCQLSPENLCGDGEFSRSHVAARRKFLMERRSKLLADLAKLPCPSANLNIVV